MIVDEPLPLIERPRLFEENFPADEIPQTIFNSPHMEFWGYAVIGYTWLLFVVTINTIFETWRYAIAPLARSKSASIRDQHAWLEKVFLTIDKYVLSLWCVYVIAWWWAFVSWWGIKLFRHSKGSQN